jgi:beta-galactosidase
MNRRNFLLTTTAGIAFGQALHGKQAAESARAANAVSGEHQLLFGADYYPDQTPESLWEQDAAEMAAMGITNVRVAEFSWALLEHEEGKFDLQRAISSLHSHGLAVGGFGAVRASKLEWDTIHDR